MQMNRQWMYGSRVSGAFVNGLRDFLLVADANKQNGFVVCPCSVCKNQKDYSSKETLHLHLLRHGERGVIMEDNEEEDDDNYPGFPEYGDAFMGEGEGEGEGEAEEEAHDEPVDQLGRTIADAKRGCETEKEK